MRMRRPQGPAVIAEAVDAALLLWRALWVWILAGAAVGTLGALGCAAGVWWAVTALRRSVHRLLGPSEALSAPQSDETPENAPRLPQPGKRRSTPRWALPSSEPADDRKRSEAA